MILITTALRAEAEAIIERLRLKGTKGPYDVYSSSDYVLVITGVGCLRCAACVGWAFGNFENIKGAVNIGIAGGCGLCTGETVIASSVEYSGSRYIQIPDTMYNNGSVKECRCVTSDTVVKNVQGDTECAVYDMEAYGFMSAVSSFLTNDRMAVLKLVSDNVNGDRIPSADEVKALVKSGIDDIHAFLDVFSKYCNAANAAPSFEHHIDVISAEYCLTQSQTARLKKALHNSYVYNGTLPDLDKLPLSLNGTKKQNTLAFERLMDNIRRNVDCTRVEKAEIHCVRRRSFRHIYIENDIFNDAETKRIIAGFPDANIVKIPHYKAVFNRNKQNFNAQQCGKDLILARSHVSNAYKGSDYCNAFGFDKFYYCSTVMGCLYNCEYCYLQGIYPSANIVAFLNTEDFFEEIEKLTNGERALVCCSYDSDILALDGILGTVKKWLDFAKRNPRITLEIRTKSANISPFSCEALPNVIIAYTLSPESVCREYESFAPPLNARLVAADTLAGAGWRVRLCMEPVLVPIVETEDYFLLADTILQHCRQFDYEDIVVGEFRMNRSCYNKIAEHKHYSKLFHNPFEHVDGEYTSYLDSEKAVAQIAEYLRNNTDKRIITFEYGQGTPEL